jgi:hypothetical protein
MPPQDSWFTPLESLRFMPPAAHRRKSAGALGTLRGGDMRMILVVCITADDDAFRQTHDCSGQVNGLGVHGVITIFPIFQDYFLKLRLSLRITISHFIIYFPILETRALFTKAREVGLIVYLSFISKDFQERCLFVRQK